MKILTSIAFFFILSFLVLCLLKIVGRFDIVLETMIPNETFWLFISGGGIGIAAGLISAKLWKG